MCISSFESNDSYRSCALFLPQILHNRCFQLLPGITVVPREIEEKSYAKFWDKQRALWYLWKWWILPFQWQQRPDEQGWSACSFELICCYLFTRAEPVPSSWKNRNMLRLWWSQFGPIKINIKKQFHDTQDWREIWLLFMPKGFLNLG